MEALNEVTPAPRERSGVGHHERTVMTATTVSEPVCPIELDPLAAPCGTGLEGWGGPLPQPVTVCRDGETVQVIYVGELQQATIADQLGPCPTAAPATSTVGVPQALPVTGTSEVVQASVAGSLVIAGIALLRLARR